MEIEPELTRGRENGAFAGTKSNSYGGYLFPGRITRSNRKINTRMRRRSSLSANVNILSGVDWFWTCAGKALAYREADALFSCEGKQIGHFRGDEIYGRDGNYLGEVARTGRLTTKLNKLRWRRSGFFPSKNRCLDPPPDVMAENILAGFKDFKIPRQFS
jgi:hypothetical protein